VKTCETCKHWDQGAAWKAGWGACLQVGCDEAGGTMVICVEEEPVFRSDFGCILHEEKSA
jgi:hypothetical protein